MNQLYVLLAQEAASRKIFGPFASWQDAMAYALKVDDRVRPTDWVKDRMARFSVTVPGTEVRFELYPLKEPGHA